MMSNGDRRCKRAASYRLHRRNVYLCIEPEYQVSEGSTSPLTQLVTFRFYLPLPAQIQPHEQVATVDREGAYDTKMFHAAIAVRYTDAVIPFRRNGRPWKEDGQVVEAGNKHLTPS